jgi:hypothetical protein
MNSSPLKDIFVRAESWPVEDQIELLRAAAYIENKHSPEFKIDDDDWKIVDARIEAAKLSGLASEKEIEALFNKYRAA